MNNMNSSRTNKDSDATGDFEAKKTLQTQSDSSVEPEEYSSDEDDEDDEEDDDSDTSQYEEFETSSDSSQDSNTLELPKASLKVGPNEKEEDKDTSQSDSSDTSSDTLKNSPALEIPKALLEVDQSDQESVVKAIGTLVSMINSQLNAIALKVVPKSPADYFSHGQRQKLWRMRRREKALSKESPE